MLEVARPHQAHYSADTYPAGVRASEPLSIRSLLDVVGRRRIVLALSVAATLALGLLYIALSPAKYAATVTLLIDFRRAQLSQTEESATIVDQAAIDSQIELLRSEKIVRAVINKLDLVNDPDFGHGRRATGKGEPGSAAADGSSLLATVLALPQDAVALVRDALSKLRGSSAPPVAVGEATDEAAAAADLEIRGAIGLLTRDLWVARLGHSYLVSVTFNSTDPVKASRIANAVAEAYTSDQIGAKVQSAKDENAWFTAQVNEMRGRAAQAYRAVQDFKADHDINPLRDFGVEQDMDKLGAEASRARVLAANTRAGLDRAESLLSGPLRAEGGLPDGTILRSFAIPEIDQLLTRYSELQAAQSKLLGPAKGDPADLRRIAEERVGVVDKIWTDIAAAADQNKTDWIAAYGQQQALEGRLADIKLRDTRARLIQERLRELETTAATSRSLYESYLNQLTHAAQQQPVPASDARVITAATVPLFPSTPKIPLTLVLAALAGVGLGVTLTFLFESMDDVIRTREQLEATSGLPYLGIVPKVRMPRRMPLRESAIGNLMAFGPSLFLATGSRRSRAADTLQSLRLAADAGLNDVSASIIGITSATAGEGKSTIAVNLAISAANSGRRVLLVDCNARNATVSAAFEPKEMTGQFGGDRSFNIRDVVHTDYGVDVLTIPLAMTADGSELPDTRLLSAVMTDARDRYDYAILDLPAILPLGNVRAIVNLIDVVVLVTRWGKTSTQQLERALSVFPQPDRILGLVLNGVKLKTMRRFEGSRSRRYADRA